MTFGNARIKCYVACGNRRERARDCGDACIPVGEGAKQQRGGNALADEARQDRPAQQGGRDSALRPEGPDGSEGDEGNHQGRAGQADGGDRQGLGAGEHGGFHDQVAEALKGRDG